MNKFLRFAFVLCLGILLSPFKSNADVEKGVEAYEKGNFETAYQELLETAQEGDAEAQRYLGVLYLDGKGVNKDVAEAIKWFERAANQGDVGAALYLGMMYDQEFSFQGYGVTQDYEEAWVWFFIAAQGGSGLAQAALGNYYKDGLGVYADLTFSYEWHTLAIINGFGLSYVARKVIEEQMHEQMILMALQNVEGFIEDTKNGEFHWIVDIESVNVEDATKFPYKYKRTNDEIRGYWLSCGFLCFYQKLNSRKINKVVFKGVNTSLDADAQYSLGIIYYEEHKLPIPTFYVSVDEFNQTSEKKEICLIYITRGRGFDDSYGFSSRYQEFYMDEELIPEDIEWVSFDCKKIDPVSIFE